MRFKNKDNATPGPGYYKYRYSSLKGAKLVTATFKSP